MEWRLLRAEAVFRQNDPVAWTSSGVESALFGHLGARRSYHVCGFRQSITLSSRRKLLVFS